MQTFHSRSGGMMCVAALLLGFLQPWGLARLEKAALLPAVTIQSMIDSAADGASLDIAAGTYTENLTIPDKNITLRGANRATTIIQAASSSQAVITATSNKGLRLENLTISGGHPASAGGGGVNAAGGTLQIVNCQITGNSAGWGGGVFLGILPPDTSSNLIMSGSQVDHNSAANHGGGVYAAGSATLNNTTLDANTAGVHGGGLHVAGSSTVITGGVFSGNHATGGNGGAVNVDNALTISGATFSGNSAGDLGGAVTQWNAPAAVSISGSTFTGNSAVNKGGGAYISGSLTLSGSGFTTNTVGSSSTLSAYGGGLYAGGPLQVSTSTFTGNQSNSKSVTGVNGGGGLEANYTTDPVSITTSQFDGNIGWFGANLGVSGSVSATHSSFKNGQGGYGGGIDAYALTGDWLTFQDNHVTNFGGGVAASNVTLNHSSFIHNSAQKGGAIQVYSLLSPSSNLLFASNSASGGAAVHAEAGTTLTFYNITIAQPIQGTGPAIALDANVTVNLYNSIVNNYTYAITFSGTGTLTEDYNLFYNNNVDVSGGTYIGGGHTTGMLPPGFANPAGGNYHLAPNSKAIGAGHNYGLTTDLDGRSRLSSRNDVGAYQFWASTFIPVVKK